MLRFAYTRPMRLWADRPDILTPVRWYRAAKGAKQLPFPTAFGSRIWDRKDDPPAGVGEVTDSPLQWQGGRDVLGYKGQGPPCGAAAAWLGLTVLGVNPAFDTDGRGGSTCCGEGRAVFAGIQTKTVGPVPVPPFPAFVLAGFMEPPPDGRPFFDVGGILAGDSQHLICPPGLGGIWGVSIACTFVTNEIQQTLTVQIFAAGDVAAEETVTISQRGGFGSAGCGCLLSLTPGDSVEFRAFSVDNLLDGSLGSLYVGLVFLGFLPVTGQ